MNFRNMQEQWEATSLEPVEFEHDDDCPCRSCRLSDNYQNKNIVASGDDKWEEWLINSTEPETEFTSEEIEFVNSVQHNLGLTDEELAEFEKLFGHTSAQQPKKDVKKEKKDDQEWTQLTCIHPKDYTIINEAGGVRFKYCKRCKKDLGDVK